VQKLLDQYSLQELLPKLNWKSGDLKNIESRPLGIIALFLHRRGMYLHVENWRKPAEDRACDSNTKYFIEAINHNIHREYNKALASLQLCGTHDHVIENHKGECFALKGELLEANRCFLML
jgi:hypothetical protein